MARELQRVVVSGIGVATPIGSTIEDFWYGLLQGRSGVSRLKDEAYADMPTHIGACVDSENIDGNFTSKEKRRMSRSTLLAMVAADEAIKQARLDDNNLDRSEIGVIIASAIGGYSASDPLFGKFYTGGRTSPFTIPLSMNVGPSSNVSIKYGFQGPLMTVDAACASAAHSIGHAFNLIRAGTIKIAVTGGADSPFSPGVVSAWCALRAMSERNDNPEEACRPFSADRDGLVLGEGAGILIIESERSAYSRGVQPLAEITGYGASGDSYHLTRPTFDGPVRAMRLAISDADLSPEEIQYVNAHGTGTPANDRNETAAIKEVFKNHAYRIPVVSTKAALGHSIGASAALELISCILSIRDQIVPPTINYKVPDPDCDLNYVISEKQPTEIKNALSNSFAFGGSNGVLIVSHTDSGNSK